MAVATISPFGSPIPLSDIEAVLAWVDKFKLSRPTKKINRDFSDAVLLAEILALHYPKLVEMHNYPPRNSHALKLNNWMTLNRKVLKKLRLNLCCNTMEQLANSAPGVIERVLIMVRDKIRRDEELNKSTKDTEQNLSSGGSYYEACGPDEDNVLMIPLKMRVNGVLETVQQKVVSHEHYAGVKQELKDARDTADLLKQKVDHLDSMLKLKDERIDELQRQLDRKQQRRRDADVVPSLPLPPDDPPATPLPEPPQPISKTQSLKNIESHAKIKLDEDAKEPTIKPPSVRPSPKVSAEVLFKASKTEIERIKSDVFKEAELIESNTPDGDTEEFKDSEPGVITIGDAIDTEIIDITAPPEDYMSKEDSFYN